MNSDFYCPKHRTLLRRIGNLITEGWVCDECINEECERLRALTSPDKTKAKESKSSHAIGGDGK